VDTPEQGESLVRACRFAPQGQRSMGGNRGTAWDSAEDMEQLGRRLNEEILVVAMIESQQAIKNLPAILEVEGIDLLACGPMDLAQSMGHSGNPSHPDVADAIKGIGEQARAAGRQMDTDVAASVFLASLLVDALSGVVREARSGDTSGALGLI
jgi:2-keto-3-deoxy-L-rhamnonate aldolase RhmA